MRRTRTFTVGFMTTAVLVTMVQIPSTASSAQPSVTPAAVGNSSQGSDQVGRSERGTVLGSGWAKSTDRLVVTRGDATGLHLLAADESAGYAFRTVASLSEPGVETDRWIGNFCLTQSGRDAVVVYGPRSFTNQPDLMQRGAFTAVVNMATGLVRKIPLRSTLAYFNPGCGVGESAVVTQSKGGDDPSGTSTSTRLFTVDAATGVITKPVSVAGQLTSAVPAKGGIVAAASRRLVSVSATGKLTTLSATSSVPYKLVPDSDGGVTYLDHVKDSGRVNYVTGRIGDTVVTLVDGPLAQVDLERGAGGHAQILGLATRRRALPWHVAQVRGERALEVSSLGHLGVIEPKVTPPTSRQAAPAQPRSPEAGSSEWTRSMTLSQTDVASAAKATIQTRVYATGKTVRFEVTPGVRSAAKIETGAVPHPLDAAATPPSSTQPTAARTTLAPTAMAANSPTSSIDDAATCSIPRNDPSTQVYQPTPRQVEWATNQAVTGNLTMTRPANWKQSGMTTSWTPQGLFPSIPLTGGGRVPSQIMLGIMSQESNLWQASGHALSGVPGNPLIGNFYGRAIYDLDQSNDWDIDFSKADCGYGITQLTDGMRKASAPRPDEVILSATSQRAVATDYATNIAAGLRNLQGKWNQTKAAGIVHSDGDPANMENWFFAIWAYNSGLHAQAGTAPWGLGWTNNPANPNYETNRLPFGELGTDASHPQDWPYPEKVIGFAAYSIATLDGPGFVPAWWTSTANRTKAQPPISTFCTSDNTCVPGGFYTPNAPANGTDASVIGEPDGPCAHTNAAGQYDLKCWWHTPKTFNDCANGTCGYETLRFNSTYPEQPDGTHNPPNCGLAGLPSGALVIDDVPSSAPPISTTTRPCPTPGNSAGFFAMTFNPDAQGRYPSKVDFHQIGVGYGGHMWFAHTRTDEAKNAKLGVTGTWTFSTASTSWSRVLVHMPDTGAHTQQAAYKINLGDGTTKIRYALQRTQRNGWVSLGVVKLNGTPSISLSSVTKDGRGEEDIAFDAVAIASLGAKPANFVVALGDSYTSGEGASDPAGGPYQGDPDADDYYKETDVNGALADDMGRNACHRSPFAWPGKAVLADNMGASIGRRESSWDSSMDFQLLACSGAQTENINPRYTRAGYPNSLPVTNAFNDEAQGPYGEMTQIDKGYLDENTTLVMLSIGGNDARFGDVIAECLLKAGLYSCPDAQLSGESEHLSVTVPRDVNDRVKKSIEQTLQEINKRAPNAKIMLMGYPKLLENDGACFWPLLVPYEAGWLNDMVGVSMNPMMQSVADTLSLAGTPIPVSFANPIADFSGRAICGNPESIHGIVNNKTAGDDPSILAQPTSSQSFHPTLDGTTLYANAANRALRDMGK